MEQTFSRTRKQKNKGVAMACSSCGSRNYKATRSRGVGSERLELRKFCPKCNGHRLHQECR